MRSISKAVSVSVVIPMYNAQNLIERCLVPLLAMRDRGEIAEIIVVDDGSTDRSQAVVQGLPGVQIARMPSQGGPGAARNLGSTLASGSHLWFVDADVIVADDAGRVLCDTLRQEDPSAVIGSYDNEPAARNFLSRYKNLVHHYYHHRGNPEASTFWSGCGAVERELFQRLGGFDTSRYRHPSIEDIELGYRITDAHGRIVLQRRLQGKHLKEWRFVNLVHTEIFRRALPWSQLMLERRNVSNDLNVGKSERVRAALAGLAVLVLSAWAIGWVGGWAPLVMLVGLMAANLAFLGFFTRVCGPLFAVRAFLFHQIYYLYSSATFAVAAMGFLLNRVRLRVNADGHA